MSPQVPLPFICPSSSSAEPWGRQEWVRSSRTNFCHPWNLPCRAELGETFRAVFNALFRAAGGWGRRWAEFVALFLYPLSPAHWRNSCVKSGEYFFWCIISSGGIMTFGSDIFPQEKSQFHIHRNCSYKCSLGRWAQIAPLCDGPGLGQRQ